MRERYEYT
ncbi:hypothetical protein A2U01_0107096, partial [Trifolium medium]|nr:hypothetical protein [Trifolium medium]